ncbi:hypothetical protein [Rhodococcus sp. GA1]|uniref:hypothetical protein n=1 Tax=Rhodococcus sp. GA1 TaxID=2942275 RepID=UPI0020CF30B2|nr:hypothetical protein [Rhodococcus sp. GA1]
MTSSSRRPVLGRPAAALTARDVAAVVWSLTGHAPEEADLVAVRDLLGAPAAGAGPGPTESHG